LLRRFAPRNDVSGALRGEAANVRLDVIASEAKQSIFLSVATMDCFVAWLLAMTVYT
jgi:hypothetical protein